MTLTSKKLWLIGGGMLLVALIVSLILYFLPGGNKPTTQEIGSFGTAPTIVGSNGTLATTSQNSNPVLSGNTTEELSPVFAIANVPVVSATLIDLKQPTTTVARYITGQDGHILDLSLDVPGSAPRIVSNTTIPGIERALWIGRGSGVIVQYFEGSTVKSARLVLPSATTTETATSTKPVAIRFLPDNIIDIASSPDGSQIAYLLVTSSGADGYIARTDTLSAKKVFSLPLSELLLSWPSANKLLVQQKSAVGVPGIAFSVDAKTGAVSPLLYGQGLTVAANSDFSTLLYQTNSGAGATDYVQNGDTVTPASFGEFTPGATEQCLFVSVTTALCVGHAGNVPPNYLDLWHQGIMSVADALLFINVKTATSTLITIPGESGGQYSDIINLAISQNGSYASFVSKDDAKLWGVRLTK